jgi:hypothetical protein
LNVYGELSGGDNRTGEGEGKILGRGEEDGGTLHIYVRRHHDETHQTLLAEGGKGSWGIGIEWRGKLAQDTLYTFMQLSQGNLRIINA